MDPALQLLSLPAAGARIVGIQGGVVHGSQPMLV